MVNLRIKQIRFRPALVSICLALFCSTGPVPRPACRWLPAVLAALVLSCLAPVDTIAQETVPIPVNSPLIPDVDGVTGPDFIAGESFRLLFVTDETFAATPTDISVYNRHVQNSAASGSREIRVFSGEFRALISTAAVDMRDNAATNHDKDLPDIDAPIYWLGGDKIADDYADFYDGEWPAAARLNFRNKIGNLHNQDLPGRLFRIPFWTGSKVDGTGEDGHEAGQNQVRTGEALNRVGAHFVGAPGGLPHHNSTAEYFLYALSPVLSVSTLPVIQFQQSTYSVREDDAFVAIFVTINSLPLEETRIRITTLAATTAPDNGYRFPDDGIVVFESGGRSVQAFVIDLFDDDVVELNRELHLSFELLDNNAIRGVLFETMVTIRDDDMPAIGFEQAEYTIFEGTTGTVTLVADQPPVVETRIELTTLSATIANDKYSLSPAVLVFQRGQSTASFEVPIIDDNNLQATQELHLSFDVSTNNAERGMISETVIRIKDNTAPIASLEVVGGGIRVEEGKDVTLRVTLDRMFAEETSITITTTGTAMPDIDYTIDPEILRFPAGSTSVQTVLSVNSDEEPETDETIILSLEADNPLVITDEPRARLTLIIEGVILLLRMKVFLEGAQ